LRERWRGVKAGVNTELHLRRAARNMKKAAREVKRERRKERRVARREWRTKRKAERRGMDVKEWKEAEAKRRRARKDWLLAPSTSSYASPFISMPVSLVGIDSDSC
jgi:hypothetical protein